MLPLLYTTTSSRLGDMLKSGVLRPSAPREKYHQEGVPPSMQAETLTYFFLGRPCHRPWHGVTKVAQENLYPVILIVDRDIPDPTIFPFDSGGFLDRKAKGLVPAQWQLEQFQLAPEQVENYLTQMFGGDEGYLHGLLNPETDFTTLSPPMAHCAHTVQTAGHDLATGNDSAYTLEVTTPSPVGTQRIKGMILPESLLSDEAVTRFASHLIQQYGPQSVATYPVHRGLSASETHGLASDRVMHYYRQNGILPPKPPVPSLEKAAMAYMEKQFVWFDAESQQAAMSQVLDALSAQEGGTHILYGHSRAGKTTAMRAFADFVDAHPDAYLRIEIPHYAKDFIASVERQILDAKRDHPERHIVLHTVDSSISPMTRYEELAAILELQKRHPETTLYMNLKRLAPPLTAGEAHAARIHDSQQKTHQLMENYPDTVWHHLPMDSRKVTDTLWDLRHQDLDLVAAALEQKALIDPGSKEWAYTRALLASNDESSYRQWMAQYTNGRTLELAAPPPAKSGFQRM